MTQAGYLADLRALQVLLQADFDALHTRWGDFVAAELDARLFAANAPAQVLAAFQAHAATRKALLFTPTVATTDAIQRTLRSTLVDLFVRRALRWVQTRQGAWVLSLGA